MKVWSEIWNIIDTATTDDPETTLQIVVVDVCLSDEGNMLFIRVHQLCRPIPKVIRCYNRQQHEIH